MKYKKTMILVILAIFLLSISNICASEIENQTMTKIGNQDTMELSSDNEINEDNLETAEKNTKLKYDNEKILTDSEGLGENPGTYSELREEIGPGGNIELEHDYYTYDSGSAITITQDNTVIDGKGAIIDMAGSSIQAFIFNGAGLTLKNLSIINVNYNGDGGAIYTSRDAYLINCTFINNTASGDGGVIYGIYAEVENCTFINNTASGDGGAIYTGSYQARVINSNFANNKAAKDGGAIYTGPGVISKSNFTNNTSSRYGGAINIGPGNVINCNFINNTATEEDGGAIFSHYQIDCTITNSNFTNNNAKRNGGAIRFNGTRNSGTYLNNCNFINNTATEENGGAIYFYSQLNLKNSNFTNNKAYAKGGSIYFNGPGNVTNCSFTNNSAYYGGAIDLNGKGNVTNCSFTINTASRYGGAIHANSANVSDSNFTNNSAEYGGAIDLNGNSDVKTCNFINNTAKENHGGAILISSGRIENSNFINNTAAINGGAVYFEAAGNLIDSNFTGNNASTGSAIYFYSSSATKTISNSILLNNRAKGTLNLVQNDNNIIITFIGQNNLLNAIYSNGEVSFTNVTYWGANGTQNTGSSTTSIPRSDREAGQNVTVDIFVDGSPYLNEIKVTDNDGNIVLNFSDVENYLISIRHYQDSYYTESAKLISNMIFDLNVTSQTIHNKTVNITAKSNIPNEILGGKLIFILPNTNITANYLDNGTWWAVYTFDEYSEYEINAIYEGLDNVNIKNGILSLKKANSTITIDNIVISYGDLIIATPITEGATGIIAKINGSDVSVNEFAIIIPDLAAGNYILTVTTIPDEDHETVTKTVNLTVNKANTTISFNQKNLTQTLKNIEINYGETKNITVITEGTTGITAKIDNQTLSVNEYTIQISNLNIGTHRLTVTTIPDENHNPTSITVNITVNKIESTITIEDIELNYGETKNITATTEGTTGITAKIDDTDVSVDGYTISISDLKAGTHTLTVTTIPDENHTAVTETATITLNKINSTLTIDDIEFNYNTNGTAEVSYEGANGVEAIINGHDEAKITIEENKIIISELISGNYTLTATTIPDENHTATTNEIKVTVNKIITEITVNDLNTAYNKEDYLIVTLKDENDHPISGAEITVDIEGKVNYTTDENGQIKVPTKDLTIGKYNTVITYEGDKNYIGSSEKANIIVNRIKTRLIFKNMNTTAFDSKIEGRIGEYFNFQLVDEYGNPIAGKTVEIGFNGVKYNCTTDKNGNANLQINLRVANPYTFAIAFLGDDEYMGSFEVALITITQQTPKISAANRSYKSTAKTKTLAATLKTSTGKALAGKKVTFTVNGKTYSAKTNAKGIATVKVSLNKKGSYKFTAKFTGDKTYKTISKTATLSIK